MTATLPRESLRPDEQPVSQYRAISRAAVAALGLGIVSSIILINPILAPVGVVAILVAVAALRTIARSEGQIIGQTPAIAGLCLATLFLGWGVTRHFSRQTILESSARSLADGWIQLVQDGKLQEALQLRQAPASRITAPDALAEHYKNPEAAKELQQFGSQNVVKDLLTLGQRAHVRFEGFAYAVREGFDDRLALKYTYDLSSAPDGRQPFWIHLNRRMDSVSKRAGWQVDGATPHPPQGSE